MRLTNEIKLSSEISFVSPLRKVKKNEKTVTDNKTFWNSLKLFFR